MDTIIEIETEETQSEELLICADCGAEIEAGDECEIDSRILCDSCFEEYHTCADCGDICHEDNLESFDRNYYCTECFNDSFTTCYSCDETIPIDDSIYSELAECSYCESCYNEIFSYCGECDNECYMSDMRYDDESGESMCSDCYSNRPQSGLIEYGHTRPKKFFGSPKNGAYNGIELEVHSPDRDGLVEELLENFGYFIECKHDGSLHPGYGFEIATQPADTLIHKEKWEKIFDILDEYNTTSYNATDANHSYGLHIHVSSANITELQKAKLLCFIHNPSNRPFIRKIAQRDSAQYGSYNEPKSAKDVKSKNGGKRTVALNLTNSHTIEFRLFRGTTYRLRFYACLDFVASLVEFTAPCERSIADSINKDRYLVWLAKNAKRFKHAVKYFQQTGFMQTPINEEKGKKLCA